MVDPFPLIEIAGPPRERGRQYGAQAATRIHLGVKHYSEQLGRASFAWSSIAALVREYVPHMERFDPSYVEEMRGIAEGAQIDFEAVALLNARTEILKLGQRPDLRAKLVDATAEACTGVVVLPSATRDGRLVHAQNWDWKAECADTAVVRGWPGRLEGVEARWLGPDGSTRPRGSAHPRKSGASAVATIHARRTRRSRSIPSRVCSCTRTIS